MVPRTVWSVGWESAERHPELSDSRERISPVALSVIVLHRSAPAFCKSSTGGFLSNKYNEGLEDKQREDKQRIDEVFRLAEGKVLPAKVRTSASRALEASLRGTREDVVTADEIGPHLLQSKEGSVPAVGRGRHPILEDRHATPAFMGISPYRKSLPWFREGNPLSAAAGPRATPEHPQPPSAR